ncbi:MAG: sarcosine oxidase subunit alpha family protein [Actinomycetota bacterium]|nr:sarcosine oxidase subunit alpha family protein [Actinomycetota bacterium]
MTQPFRTGEGGHIDRRTLLRFSFNGKPYTGYQGDTLASALLANGIHLVARSSKYHRPRGIYTAGPEEPNALVRIGTGPHTVPNIKATEVPLYDGLVATSQRGWPATGLDAAAVLDVLGPLLPPGFYYKTFIAPRRLWPWYEHMLRRAAWSARASSEPDPDRHEKRHEHCDVLVIGAGPAGLMAALAASRAGGRVVLADENPMPGGSLLDHQVLLDGVPAREWVDSICAELAAAGVVVLSRTTVFGRYLQGRFGAVQHLEAGFGRQRFWQIQAERAVLASGAIERPLVFPNNDRPGVMLASAVQRYLRRFGVTPGRRAVVFTNNETAHGVAAAMIDAGVDVRAVVDVRPQPEVAVCGGEVPVLDQARVVDVKGRRHVRGVEVAQGSQRHVMECDLLCVSGGWTPMINLYGQGGEDPVYDERWGAFVPAREEASPAITAAGACNGTQGLGAILREGREAGRQCAEAAGQMPGGPPRIPDLSPDRPMLSVDAAPLPFVKGRGGKAFVDLQTDVHLHDIEVALREGYDTVEHVKRYTTLGMGTDQGKTGNINAMRAIAHLQRRSTEEVGTTTFRPPYVPVTLGALAARESGPRIVPLRRSPIHPWHQENGAVFMASGLWIRPQYFRGSGNGAVEAATREAGNVRRNVGIADVSTLGKIDLQGPDVAEFLDRIYINHWTSLAVGRARYGVMLRDDGYVFDDGTTARLGEHHYLMTTTTGNAEAVLAHLEFYHQQVWPHLDLHLTSVTDQWAVVALAGPHSRQVLAGLLAGEDVGNEALPFMGVRQTRLHGLPARVSRISFSGELAYEIAVPADAGLALWETLLEVGRPLGILPYGLEAMDYLRIEKGHLVVGMDIDGRVGPYDLGLGAMCSTKKDFVGRRSLQKPVFHDRDRQVLAGFVSVDGRTMISAGAQLLARPFDGTPQPSLGRITSRAFSPAMARPIALGLVVGGAPAHEGRVHAVSPVTGEHAEVEVVAPRFYDPTGERMKS